MATENACHRPFQACCRKGVITSTGIAGPPSFSRVRWLQHSAVSYFASGPSGPRRQSTGSDGQLRGVAGWRWGIASIRRASSYTRTRASLKPGPRDRRCEGQALIQRHRRVEYQLSRAETTVGNARLGRCRLQASRPSSSPRNDIISVRAERLLQRCRDEAANGRGMRCHSLQSSDTSGPIRAGGESKGRSLPLAARARASRQNASRKTTAGRSAMVEDGGADPGMSETAARV